MDAISSASAADHRSATNRISPVFERKMRNKEKDLVASSSAGGNARRSSGSKDSVHSVLNCVHKSTSQIKKPQHRKNVSPLNWFPRKKTDSYLMRKIRHLQEIEGMNLSLDETLGNACPHYTRMTREKIAAREAARKAMEARKAAMVEASWCRILQAARIQSKEAEVEREKAEKYATEAFDAARSLGVMMYDKPECPRRPCEIETSSAIGGKSTHKVTASFETAFEVDKEVSAAVKKAFVQLASCSSSLNKEEFRDLLRRISQNPDADDTIEDHKTEISSETDGDAGSELDQESQVTSDTVKKRHSVIEQRKQTDNLLFTGCNDSSSMSPSNIADMLLGRLKILQEDELNSLATIVATCGLNAALLEVESNKDHEKYSITSVTDDSMRKKEATAEIPSLDQVLVKRVSRFEKEIQEARELNKSNSGGNQRASEKSGEEGTTEIPSLDKCLVRHVSKLEKEVKEARNLKKNNSVFDNQKHYTVKMSGKETDTEIPSLDKCLVKHVSKLEKEVQEARNSRKSVSACDNKTSSTVPVMQDFGRRSSKFQMSSESNSDLGSALVKHISRLEREVQEARKNTCKSNQLVEDVTSRKFNAENAQTDSSSRRGAREVISKIADDRKDELQSQLTNSKEQLDIEVHEYVQSSSSSSEMLDKENMDLNIVTQSAVPQNDMYQSSEHQTSFEKEHMNDKVVKKKVERLKAFSSQDGIGVDNKHEQTSSEKILIKPISQLEKDRKHTSEQDMSYVKHGNARKEARERELLAAWGGLSLDSSVRPRLSRLEKEKAAWRQAEEEERKRE